MRTTRVRFLSALLLATMACGDESAEPRPHGSGDPETLAASVILSIGAREGPDELVLSRAFSGFLRNDRIFVANGAPPEIREYDSSGRLVRRIGRAGSGPGEFRQLTWIAPFGSDSIIALDGRLLRATVFGPQGEYARSFGIDVAEYGRPEWLGAYGDLLALGISRGVDPRRLQVADVARDSLTIAFVSATADTPHAVVRSTPPIAGRWWRRERAVGAVRITALEDGPRPLVAVRDTLLVATSNDFAGLVRWNGASWDTVSVLDEARPSADHRTGAAVRPGRYEHLAVGSGGEIWVAALAVESNGRRTWWIVRPEGGVRAVLRLPAGFGIWQVGDGWLLGRRVDDLGVEYVELWQIEEGRG